MECSTENISPEKADCFNLAKRLLGMDKWNRLLEVRMMKRREALEAYRKSRAGSSASQSIEPAVATPPVSYRAAMPQAKDPAVHAAQGYEKWIADNAVAELVEHYAFLPSPSQRQKVLTWAVEKAREGNLHPLLSIGIDDVEPLLRKQLNRQLETIPAEVLLAKLAEERFTIKERRSVAGLLGRCKDPQAGRIMAKLASHEDAQVRESALQALAHFPITNGLQLPIFTRLLENDPHPDVQLRAAEGLARLGTPEAVAVLTKASRKDDVRPEVQAVLAGLLAKRRPKDEYDPTGQSSAKGEKKAFPTEMIPKILFVVVLLIIAGYRLSEPAKRWYDKKFPAAEEISETASN